MNKKIHGVTGFDVFPLGKGREIFITTVDGEQFSFSLGEALVNNLITYLQNPMKDYRNSGTTQPSGILSGK